MSDAIRVEVQGFEKRRLEVKPAGWFGPRLLLDGQRHVLEYPTFTKTVGWCLLLVWGGLLHLITSAPDRAPFWGLVLFGALLTGCACMTLEFSLTRGTWNDYEVTLLRSRTGVKIRLHRFLGGLPHVLQEMKARVSLEVYATCEEQVENCLDHVTSATHRGP